MYDGDRGSMGIVFIDGKKMNMHIVKCFSDTEYVSRCVQKDNMKLQSKFRGGGQSAQRFDRKEEGIRQGYLSKYDDLVRDTFYDKENNRSIVDLLVICGPGTLRNELSRGTLISKYFSKIMRVRACSNLNIESIVGEYFGDIMEFNNDHLVEIREMIERADDRLSFGAREIREGLKMCILEKVITSDKNIVKNLNYEPEIIILENSSFLDMYGGSIGVRYY